MLSGRLLLVCGIAGSLLVGGCSRSVTEVDIVPGASLGGYKVVHVTFADGWAASHAAASLLQQELARRRFAVRLEAPPPNLRNKTLRLHVLQASEKSEPSAGGTEDLRHLHLILSGPDGNELATVRYEGEDLDRMDQMQLISSIADELFGWKG